MSFLANRIQSIDDRLNPIAVKELRQGVQSRFMLLTSNLLLFLLVVITSVFLYLSPEMLVSGAGGRDLYLFLQTPLFVASILLAPFYTLLRIRKEMGEADADLFFTTALSPTQIVRGKFFATMALITMLYSICAPFLLFTFLLQGFDVPSMLISLGIGYLGATVTTLTALVVGAWATKSPLGNLVAVGFFILLIYASFGLSMISIGLLQFGIKSWFDSWEEIVVILASLVGLGLGMKLLGKMAVGLISPTASNRTGPLRLWASVTLILTGGLAIGLGTALWKPLYFFVWMILATQFLLFILIVSFCERDGYSARVLRTRPKSRVLRLITFPYTSGVTGGIVWTLAHAVLLAGFAWIQYQIWFHQASPSVGELAEIQKYWGQMILSLLFCFAYGLSARLIMRTLGTRWPISNTWVVMLVLLGMVTISVFMATLLTEPKYWNESPLWQYITPVYSVDHPLERKTSILALWIAAVAIANLRWETKNFWTFLGKTPTEPIADAPDTPTGSLDHGDEGPLVAELVPENE